MRLSLVAGSIAILSFPFFSAHADGNDVDGDGRVTEAELAQSLMIEFDKLDGDKDGILTPGEQGSGADAAGDVREVFDQDGNGLVTVAEWQSSAEMLSMVDMMLCDVDRDEALTGGEIDCLYEGE